MADIIGGFLEVGIDAQFQVVVNHPDLKPDENGVGHIVFSPDQARNLAYLMIRKANEAEEEGRRAFWKKKEEEVPPVDRTARVMTDGSPETADHREIEPTTGMQKGYIVLSAEERAKGFVRPVRRTYIHVGKNPVMNGHVLIKPGEGGCGTRTTMALSIAETFARDPGFYGGTFCCTCGTHLPLNQFVWEGTDEQMGS